MPKPPPPPGPVPREALAYFRSKKVKPGFSYLDVWREEHDTAFTVAKLMEGDLLKDVKGSIAKALEEGTPFAEWAGSVKSVFDKSGWSAFGSEEETPHRLWTIYDTNLRVARAVGQWQRIERTKRTHPYLEYVRSRGAKEPRSEHDAYLGLILPVDDPFWETHMPPNGYGCGHAVRQLTKREAERRGGPHGSPPEEFVEWEHPETGKVVKVPKGVDPGWDHNPGKDRSKKLRELEREK